MIRLFSILIILLIVSCNTNNSNNKVADNKENPNPPVLSFYEDKVDLGTIVQGDVVNCKFRFKNTGKSDLIIKRVDGGCGCTSTKWEPKPIKPGQDSEISIVFNSKSKHIGKHNRKVSVTSNASEEDAIVSFLCEIVSPNKLKE